MARLPAFYPLLQSLTGQNNDASEHLTRTLRAAGLLPPSPRGHGAAHVTEQGAANMLLAVMAGGRITGVARQVEVLRSLRPKRAGGFGDGFGPLQFIAKRDTLGEALDDLLLLAPRLRAEMVTYLLLAYQGVPLEQLLDLEAVQIEFTISKPVPHAQLVLRVMDESGIYRTEWKQEWTTDVSLLMSGFYRPELQARCSMRTETTIDHRILFRLGDLLAADDEEPNHVETARTEGEAGAQGRGHAEPAAEGGTGKPRSFRYRESGLRLSKK